ncbi:MAG: permease [Desulfotomaculum sp.]|nr:permease [Desulfotomaculum sp.]
MRYVFNVILFLMAGAGLLLSNYKDKQKTKQALKKAYKSFQNILPSLLGIIGLIGLMIALVPKELITQLFGDNSPVGLFIVSVIGSITLLPAFVAFPLASSFLNAGASIAAVSCFITTLLMVGVITAPLEIEYFGKRFTFWRNFISLFLALIIGVLIGRIFE